MITMNHIVWGWIALDVFLGVIIGGVEIGLVIWIMKWFIREEKNA